MKKLINFRDLGGLAAADGKKVREGRLLRSAEPVGLLAEEIEMLKGRGVTLIVDFRSVIETSEAPVDEIDGAMYTNLDVMADKVINWADTMQWAAALSSDTAETTMINDYRGFIRMSSSKKGFGDFLRACAKAEGAILFHCAAGKDRTGFAAAIVLKILGVSDEDIYVDYLKTIEERKEANAQVIEKYRALGLGESQLEALSTIYGLKREYLDTAFAIIEEEYGDFESYIEHGLGITAEEVQRIRELYLV
ncbi:MAG: tyrosine-protein phosphatase [Defluviitaleaceae bacterium]|nr:tyrosine-protein phosphatase [Defluviitaleaceae bacterium]